MRSLSRGIPRILLSLSVAACLLCTGCSLLVMGQKMILGEPLLTSEFEELTRVDLTKGKHKLMIVCSTPESVEEELSTLKLDLIDGITRQLKREKIDVVDPDKVARWIDDHGGLPSHPAELARDFDVDYIAWIDVQQFTCREENSVRLLRGHSQGYVKVYRVAELDGERTASTVFTREFTSVYPPHKPLSEVSQSAEIFQRDYIHRVSTELAHKFYDHRPGLDF